MEQIIKGNIGTTIFCRREEGLCAGGKIASGIFFGSPKFFGETPKILGDKVKGMSKLSLKMKKT